MDNSIIDDELPENDGLEFLSEEAPEAIDLMRWLNREFSQAIREKNPSLVPSVEYLIDWLQSDSSLVLDENVCLDTTSNVVGLCLVTLLAIHNPNDGIEDKLIHIKLAVEATDDWLRQFDTNL